MSDDERRAVTAEEFAEEFLRLHGNYRPEVPDRLELDGQEWDDLDCELQSAARPASELAGIDHYVYDGSGDDGRGYGGVWVRAPLRPTMIFFPPQPEGTDMEALGETVRRIVESAPKGGGA